jgi:DNA-binding transcriptional LysR family regulator
LFVERQNITIRDVVMNLRGIDLNLLPIFEAIYLERSLTRASEALHVSQPALSNALVRLRRAFGDPLFVRAQRGMAPTPEAERLIGPVREAMGRLRGGLDRGRGFDPESSERAFNVAAGEVAASALAPALATRLLRSAPRVRFFFHQVDRAAVAGELASGRLDLAIGIPLSQPELESAPLLEDPYVCVLRKYHPAARKRLTIEKLLELSHVAVSSRRRGRTPADLALHRLGHRLRPVLRFPHYAPAFHTVAATDCALIAPASIARIHDDVVVRPLPFEAAKLALCLYWRRDANEDPACMWAREMLIGGAASARSVPASRGAKGRHRSIA